MRAGEGERFRRIGSGLPVFFARELSSTNDTLAGWVSDGLAPQGTALLCALQTGGRGRPGHRWHSRRGDLTMSRWIPPGEEVRIGAPTLPLVVAAAVLLTLDALGVRGTFWKYPNDLYALLSLSDPSGEVGKLGGLLVEPVRDGAGDPAGWIAGIGLNLLPIPEGPGAGEARDAGDVGSEMKQASLAALAGPENRAWGPVALAQKVSRTLGDLLARATPGEVRSLLDERLLWKDRWVVYSLHGQSGIVRIEGLEADGTLRVREGDGRIGRLGPSTRNLRPVSLERGQGGG